MPEPKKLLDSSTLSEVMKGRDPDIQSRAREYLRVHRRFTFSILTRYEILRGLHAKKAERQIERFEERCAASEILALTDSVVVKAAEIYAVLHQRGKIISDADILIGATALVYGLDVVTENQDHFGRIPDLQIEGWRQAEVGGDAHQREPSRDRGKTDRR